MPGTYLKVKTVITGELITASDRNNEHDNHITNMVPSGMDDFSSNVSQMQLTTNPFPSGVQSLATSMEGEILRLRYQLQQITGEANWFAPPSSVLSGSTGFVAATGAANAYVLTPPVAVTSLQDGQGFSFSIPATNTGASTLNVSGLGAFALVAEKAGVIEQPMVAGNLPIGLMVRVTYRSASNVFQVVSAFGFSKDRISSQVAYEDEANTFTALQSMNLGARVENDGLGVGVAASPNNGQIDTLGDVNVGGNLSITGSFVTEGLSIDDFVTDDPTLSLRKTGQHFRINYLVNELIIQDVTNGGAIVTVNRNLGGNAGIDVLGIVSATGGYQQPGTNAETIKTLRGTITTLGAVLRGAGFTVVRNSVGDYTVTFTTGFGGVPSNVISIPQQAGQFTVFQFTSETTGAFRVTINVNGGGLADRNFSFTSIGPA